MYYLGQARSYRACLLLDDSTKYEFGITVHGEGLKEPLGFKMFVVKDNHVLSRIIQLNFKDKSQPLIILPVIPWNTQPNRLGSKHYVNPQWDE
jgi:hypothetical protein